MRQALENRESSYKIPAQQLYRCLIAPIEQQLEQSQVNTLVFIADGFLRNIPFATLFDGKQHLIEKGYAVAISPGLRLLPPQPITKLTPNIVLGGLSKVNLRFRPLPNVPKEIEGIASVTNASLILLDNPLDSSQEGFTNSNLQNRLRGSGFPLVHLATHAQFSSNLEDTFLLTADDRIDISQLRQILRGRDPKELTPLELLVLSACETAAGDTRATLGLAGIAIRSGARSTLASLWKVADASAPVLMQTFYRELIQGKKEGISRAEALRKAQLSLLQGEYPHPYDWAPFILVGSWQ